MCLFIKRRKPRIAKFNIPVYKILIKDGARLQTPYMNALVDLKQPLVAYDTIVINPYNYYNYINEGAIHCFWNKHHAHKRLKRIEKIIGNSFDCIILKAYIPKGIPFFIGRGKSFGEIGAERIIFKL